MNQPVPFRPDRDAAFDLERRSWHRAIAAAALGECHRRDPAGILKATWSADSRAATILKAATSPTDTTSFPPLDTVGSFRSLAPGCAAFQVFERGLRLDLSGIHTVRIPNLASLPPQAIFVGDGQPAPNVQYDFGGIIVAPTKKILLLTAVTGELENATPQTASTVIGRVLSDVANRSVDSTAFSTNPADSVTPAGLLNNATVVAAAGDGPDAMSEDFGALLGAIGDAGIDTTGAIFIGSPREVGIAKTRVGPKFDFTILSTLGLPAKTVACFAPAAVCSGYQEGPTIEISRTTAVHYESSTPSEIVDSSGTVAAPVYSAFQSHLLSIKVRSRAAWGVAPGGVSLVTNVNW
jgi:hypothetical protein